VPTSTSARSIRGRTDRSSWNSWSRADATKTRKHEIQTEGCFVISCLCGYRRSDRKSARSTNGGNLHMRRVIVAAVAIAWSTSAVAAADQRDDRIRGAAARALTLLQSSQKRWYTRQTCSSCHHQFQPALAYRSARAHGIPFD